jgi:hypothetical protein
MAGQFQFEIVASFHCSTCRFVREEKTTVCTPVPEPLGCQIFNLASQQDRKCPVCGSRIAPEDQCAIRPAGAIETWPSDLPWRWNRIQKAPRQTARELLRGLASESSHVYETYRSLYHLWCTQNSAVQELRPLFRIPGIEPDGQLSVTEEFKGHVRSSAIAILASLPD